MNHSSYLLQLAAQQSSMQQAGYGNMLQSGMAQANNPAAYLNSLANGGYAPNVTPIKAGIASPPPRTPEQITAELEARYAELEAEAVKRRHQEAFACKKCVHYEMMECTNKLVIGFDPPEWIGEGDKWVGLGKLAICGTEKALWEPVPPKRSLWARFVDWFTAPWRESVPD